MNPKIAALDRAWASRIEDARDRPVPRCGMCGISIIEGAHSEAGYDELGQVYRRVRCTPCFEMERAERMAASGKDAA